MKILIVEDEPQLSKTMCTMLDMFGHEPVPALDGQKALDLLSGQSFDFVILDLMIPRVSSEEVMLQTKQQGIPVLICSADEQIQIRAQRMGAEYIRKPFDVEKFMQKIHSVYDSALAHVETNG